MKKIFLTVLLSTLGLWGTIYAEEAEKETMPTSETTEATLDAADLNALQESVEKAAEEMRSSVQETQTEDPQNDVKSEDVDKS